MKYRIPFFYDYVFPTFILPNALITELGIVNYMHSMYSNASKDSSFFDTHSGDVNPLTFLFGNNLGSWPNSVFDNNRLNLHAGCYEEHLELVEESVYFGKSHYSKRYVYPIRLSFSISEFSAVGVQNNTKLNGEYFWKHISAEALDDIQHGRAVVFLDYGQENYIDKRNFIRLHEALKYSNIPKENIILGLNTFNGEEVYASMFAPEEQMLTVKNWPFVVVNTSFHYTYHTEQRIPEDEFKQSKHRERNHYFLFKVRRPREHRLMLLYSFASAGLLDKADWSCLSNFDINQHEINNFSQVTGINLDLNKIQELQSMVPHSLVSESETYEAVGPWNDKHPQSYRDSYFYVCTETFVHGDFKSLTEKIFKPIANFQPFLFLAYPGALATLRKLGFKTFSPFIDESYDLETNTNKRIKMIYDEVSKLCLMTKKELHDWYWNMEDILIHNQQHALELHRDEHLSLDFIKYLHSRVMT